MAKRRAAKGGICMICGDTAAPTDAFCLPCWDGMMKAVNAPRPPDESFKDYVHRRMAEEAENFARPDLIPPKR